MYTKRQIKQKKLIKKLFVNIVKDLDIKKDIPLNIRFKKNGWASYCSTKSHNNIISKQVIGYCISDTKKITKEGYPNDYYYGRADYLNKYIKHNKHNSIRFILLHELKHAIDYRELGIEAVKNLSTEIKEKNCDIFAIENIKKGQYNV